MNRENIAKWMNGIKKRNEKKKIRAPVNSSQLNAYS